MMNRLTSYGPLLGMAFIGVIIMVSQLPLIVRVVSIMVVLLGAVALRRTPGQQSFDRSTVYRMLSAEISRARRDESQVAVVIISADDDEEDLKQLLPGLIDTSRLYDTCGYDQARRELVVIAPVPDDLAVKICTSRLADKYGHLVTQHASFPTSGDDAASVVANLQTFARRDPVDGVEM